MLDSEQMNSSEEIKAASTHFPYWKGEGRIFKQKDLPGGDRFPKRKIEFNLPPRSTPDSVAALGELVTSFAANAMIKNLGDELDIEFLRILDNEKDFTNLRAEQIVRAEAYIAVLKIFPYSVVFGKESLMFLLAQSGCEGIRFYTCKGPIDEYSLVLVGVNSEKEDIGTDGSIIIDNYNYETDSDEEQSKESNQKEQKNQAQNQGFERASRQTSAIVEVGGTDRPGGILLSQYDKIKSDPKYAPNIHNLIKSLNL